MAEVIKMLIGTKMSQVILGKSKEVYCGMVAIHKSCNNKSKFYTNLYPIMYSQLEQKDNKSSKAGMAPFDLKTTKEVLIHHGMHMSDNAFEQVFTTIKQTPSNRLCFIMLNIDYVIIIYCPIIDNDVDKENLSLTIYAISKNCDFFHKTLTTNFKNVINI